MNILYITLTDPRETSYGGQQRTHIIWKGLQSVGDVWTIIPVAHRSLEAADPVERVYKMCLDRRWSFGWVWGRLLQKLKLPVSCSWGIQLAPIFALGVTFDVTVARFLRTAGLTRPWRIAPMYVDVDDTPSVDYALSHPRHYLRQAIVRAWERFLCRYAQQLWVPDVEQSNSFPENIVVQLPNIPFPSAITPIANPHGDTLVFVGYMAHHPNQVAIDCFLRKYWIDLRRAFPTLCYKIVGGGLPETYRKSWIRYEGIEIVGFEPDLEKVYSEALAVLTPMEIGSGTCIKVLEALAHALPVVSTCQGLRGICPDDRTPENGIFSYSSIEELVEKITLIRAHKGAWTSAVEYVSAHYSQAKINCILHECLKIKEELQ